MFLVPFTSTNQVDLGQCNICTKKPTTISVRFQLNQMEKLLFLSIIKYDKTNFVPLTDTPVSLFPKNPIQIRGLIMKFQE